MTGSAFDGRTSVSPEALQPRHIESTQGFEDLAVPLLQALYNFAHWLTQNREDAEDLVQETYAKAFRGFKSFQPGTNFRAWIFRILRNTLLSSRAGLQQYKILPLEDEEGEIRLPAATGTPESALLARLNIELLQRAMEGLPPIFREVLLLCDVEEMSCHEAAEVLMIPIGTVMSRLSRARKKLRDALIKTSSRVRTGEVKRN